MRQSSNVKTRMFMSGNPDQAIRNSRADSQYSCHRAGDLATRGLFVYIVPETMLHMESGSNRVGPCTLVWRAFTIALANLILQALSSSAERAGLPKGQLKRVPRSTRLAPTFRATEVRLVTVTVGNPALSNSFAIVAPLRVPEPQVATSTAALTSRASRSWAISLACWAIWVNTP